MKLVCRLLEYGGWEFLAIGIDKVDLDGPCALGITFDAGRLVTIRFVSASLVIGATLHCMLAGRLSHDILLGRYLYLTRDLVLDWMSGSRSWKLSDRAADDGRVTYIRHVEGEEILCDDDCTRCQLTIGSAFESGN